MEKDAIKYFIYSHGGSKNHGCEALVRSVVKVLNVEREELLLNSFRKKDDIEFGIDNIIKTICEPEVINPNEAINHFGDCSYNTSDMGLTKMLKLLSKDSIALSIGGDNYCYGDNLRYLLKRYNAILSENEIKTALIGCSIEAEVLGNKETVEDLNRYNLIVARESLTYNALKETGIDKNLHLIPDTAFLLDKTELPLPECFIEDNTIGINLSPLVQNLENENNITFKNFQNLIEHILNNTRYNIALIPHVCWDESNDVAPLTELYNLYSNTNRVCLIQESSAEVLKRLYQ